MACIGFLGYLSRDMARWFLISLCALSAACGDDDSTTDATAGADATEMCTSNNDCDDELFCNGPEQCEPDDAEADARGCITGSLPCPASCDEETDECVTDCVDADGDGHSDMECGGDDCDDNDPDRFPGNTEICNDHDEDCDPETLGDDADEDGFVSDECCNPDGRSMVCGRDCDDSLAGVNPTAVDACGGGDEDCDGDIDEEPSLTFYRDIDGDGFGIPPRTP